MDYSKYQTTPAEPEASSMIETFRAIGYSIEAAVADVIDNSVSANAKNIWVNFEWKGKNSWIAIKDDGLGMHNEDLIQAMRPGSKNPLEDRSKKDLGRFGLGLKTASFSQCRKLSVISKKKDSTETYWTWDLDFVNQTGKWNLINYLPEGDFQKQLHGITSGTIVIWNDIDRLVRNLRTDDDIALDKFLFIMEQVKKHLAMVFHRFVEQGRIKIWFQEREIKPWNPSLSSELATQVFPDEPIHNGLVTVKGYVLPHKSKLSEEQYKDAEGPRGWNEQQGFYIYRNERLLLAGDWLNMFRQEEHYKLARILIDLPNNLDAEWQIDIKKSIARPPLGLRDQLKAYADKVRAQAVEVYRHKGKVIQRKLLGELFQPVWQEKIKGGKRYYEINRQHPLLVNKKNVGLEQVFRLLEETLPIPVIAITQSEHPDSFFRPFERVRTDEMLSLMKVVYQSLATTNTPEQIKSRLLLMEPFNEYPELIAHL